MTLLIILLTVMSGCTVTPPATPTAGAATLTSMPAPDTVPPSIVQGEGFKDTICSVLPPQSSAQDGGFFRIDATPIRYSTLLSSTPGIRMSLNSSRKPSATAEYIWNASYGTLLSWDPPYYSVHIRDPRVINRGETLYWTYSTSPGPVKASVVITVTARDSLTQAVTTTAQLTLDWDGETAVIVQGGR